MISRRLLSLKPSLTASLNAKVKEMVKQGIDVIDLSIGEPDFPTPKYITNAGIKALNNNKTKYTQVDGIPELKKVIAEYYNTREDNVIITHGSKFAIYMLLQVLLNKGDEVIIPKPYWQTYKEQVLLSNGKPVVIPSKQNFHLDLNSVQENITKNTRIMLINSPNNPTGVVYNKKEIKTIANLCEEKDIVLISDEIYRELSYDKKFISPLEYYENTILVSGMSKAYAMTGWRIGYIIGSKTIINACKTFQSHTITCACSISQYAALKALSENQHEIKRMKYVFKKRRDFIYRHLKYIFTCVKPEGGFYIFPKLREDDVKFSNELLNQQHVAVVPGTVFDAKYHIRISFATNKSKIKLAIERIKAFVEKA